jgi:hypothetical protein
MNMIEAGLIDVYDNIEKKMGQHAWLLPFAVAAGSFIFHRALMHKSTSRSLLQGALTGVSVAGIVGAGRAMKEGQHATNGKLAVVSTEP